MTAVKKGLFYKLDLLLIIVQQRSDEYQMLKTTYTVI